MRAVRRVSAAICVSGGKRRTIFHPYYIKKAPACKAQAGRARRAVHAGEHAAAGNLVVRIQHVAVKAETPAFVDARASAVAEPQLYFVAGYGERKAIDAIQK